MSFVDDGRRLAVILGRRDKAEALGTLIGSLGGLRGLYWAGPECLLDVLGASARPAVEAAFALVEGWKAQVDLPEAIDGPLALARALQPRLSLEAVEAFWVVSLDARARIAGFERVSTGTLTACLVHPREVFAPALRVRAASVVVVHNHPSGDPEPSPEDVALTDRLTEAGRLLGIPLLDHVVVAQGGVRSLVELDAA